MTDCHSASDASAAEIAPVLLQPGAGDETDAALLRLCRVIVGATVQIGNSMRPSLSAMQIRTLTVLAAVPSGLSLGAVAESLNATPSATSRICARLVRDGLVTRAAGPGNEIRLSLSAAGEDALIRLNRARLERLAPLLAAVPQPDRDGVVTALRHLADAVTHSGSPW